MEEKFSGEYSSRLLHQVLIKHHLTAEKKIVVKKIIYHLSYGNLVQSNTIIQRYQLKVLLWRYS